MLYLGLGQSLLAQVPRLRPLGERPGVVDPNRAWVFSRNGDPRVVADPTQDLPDGVLGAPVPLMRFARSGPLTAASAAILAALGPQDRLLTVNLARRGASIDAFLPGSAAFRNVERCLRRAVETADERGLRFGRLIVSWVQGQADSRSPQDRYLARMEALVAGLQAALNAAVGRAGQILMCLSQTTAYHGIGRRGVALAQLHCAERHPARVVVAGPEYMLERSDGTHLKPRSAVRLGALHGRAICRILRDEPWEPLRMVEARVSGAEVTVTFAGGTGAIEAVEGVTPPVEVGVRALPHLGFVWHAPRGVETRIVAAKVTGPREVTLTLSEPPQDVKRTVLGLGFPDGIGLPEGFVQGDPALARGGATGLRTTGGDPDPFGDVLHDWALQQAIVPRGSETA